VIAESSGELVVRIRYARPLPIDQGVLDGLIDSR
jgi:hypothetical protein